MKRSKKLPEGTFLQIPLEDGSFGYGRVLAYADIAFYDYRTTEPSTDLDEIEPKPVLFAISVRQPLPERWVQLGKRPLEGEVAKPVVTFMQDLLDFRKCTIYDSAGMVKDASPEECVGLEQSSVWDGRHIEKRLLDHFMGRPNDQVARSRVRLQ